MDLSPTIPFSKHFPEAQELRDASTLDHSRNDKSKPTTKTKTQTKTNGHSKSKHEQTPRRSRHDSPGVGAIEVEDDEVEFDDYSDAFDSEDDANATFSEGSDNDDIEAIFPQIMGALKKSGKDRYQSVSEDSDDYDIEVISEDEEEATRYNMKEKKEKTKNKSKGKNWKTNIKTDTSEEDGEIVDIPPPAKKPSDGLTNKQRRERKDRNKDFWAGKGISRDEEEEEEGEEGEVVE